MAEKRNAGARRPGVELDELRPDETDACFTIWRSGLLEQADRCPGLPRSWADEPAVFRERMSGRIQAGRAVAARSDGVLVGFMAYDSFSFHGESCVFCPTMAHGGAAPARAAAYESMYAELSARWLRMGLLTHLITFWAHDLPLREILYRLGFGLYVVDAFRSVEPIDAGDAPGFELRL